MVCDAISWPSSYACCTTPQSPVSLPCRQQQVNQVMGICRQQGEVGSCAPWAQLAQQQCAAARAGHPPICQRRPGCAGAQPYALAARFLTQLARQPLGFLAPDATMVCL